MVRLLHSTRHSIDKIALRLIVLIDTAVQWTFDFKMTDFIIGVETPQISFSFFLSFYLSDLKLLQFSSSFSLFLLFSHHFLQFSSFFLLRREYYKISFVETNSNTDHGTMDLSVVPGNILDNHTRCCDFSVARYARL